MMGILDRFRKNKEKSAAPEGPKVVTELEKLCGGDKETYEALSQILHLDPKKIGMSAKESADVGRKYEKAGEFVKANVSYEVAGGLALYEGDAKKVVEYYSAAEKVLPNAKYKILRTKNLEKAVAKAQEYYKTYLK
jgi:hypothetical protein